MAVQRSSTRRVAAGGPAAKHKTTLDDVKQGLKQLYPEPDPSKATELDIVFVPGLACNPEESWTSEKTGFNWASDKDGIARDYPTARVLLYMYESAWKGDLKVQQSIDNLGLTLLQGLAGKRDSGSTQPIIFIGHSMGGLVIAKAVCLAESRPDLFPHMFENIVGCAFFGTPFYGAEAASVAAMLAYVGEKVDQAVPSKLLDLMKPGNETLTSLRNEFVQKATSTKVSENIRLCGFFESRKTNISDLSGVPAFLKTLQIPLPKKLAEFVTQESAIIGGLMTPMGLAANHRDLVKFEGFKDDLYSMVRTPLKQIIHSAHWIAKRRRQSTRNIDTSLFGKVRDALEGAQILRKRHQIAQTTALSSWALDDLESAGWLNRQNTQQQPHTKREDCVWIRGPDGRGKTSASLAVLEGIEQMVEASETKPGSELVSLAYFFCDSSPDYGTAEDLLKSLVRQLITKHEILTPHAQRLLRRRGKDDFKGQPQLTVENLWQALHDMLADDYLIGSKVYFVINNLDVLPQDSDSTSTLLDLLKTEVQTINDGGRDVQVRWLITSGESYSIGEALTGNSVRLIDLEHEKYENQVQLDLRKHAQKKVTDLVTQKKYSKALAYFASSILGRRAQNTQWIDITCVQLEELPENENDLQVRRLLETMPQELEALLNHAWRQVFELNRGKADEIKEMLRVLVLTYEDPTEEELALLSGLYSTEKQRAELRDLVEHCRPLLVLKANDDESEINVCFIEGVVRSHLLKNSHRLLGLSEEDTKLQHGMLGLRAFTHIMETLNTVNFPVEENADVNEDDEDETEKEDRSEEEQESGNSTVATEEEEEDGDNNANGSSADDDRKDEDPEADAIMGKALAYPVKHWLHHASKATTEIAEDVSLENDFWEKDSVIRRRWLTEFVRLTGSFKYYQRSEFSGLHVASAVGFRQLVAYLIKNGHEDELGLRDSDSFTPLHFAASFGRLNIVDELLNKGAPIDDGMEEGTMTPLHMAAAEGNVKVMSKLLDRGADPSASCGAYGAVINAAIESGNCEAVRILVEKNVSLATVEDAAEADEASETGDETENGQNDASSDADDDDGDNEDGEEDESDEDEDEEDEDEGEEVIRSPLALAAVRSDLTVFEFLVKNYSERLPPKEFNIALVKAAERGRMEAFTQLLTNYSHPPETFQEALDEAAFEDEWDVVALLLEKCSELNCDEAFVSTSMGDDGDEEIQTLEAMWEYSRGSISQSKLDESLYRATDFENPRTVELLLRFGASADATGDDYGNALTAAAYDGTTDIVEMLLDAGANIDAPEGWALQAAAGESHIDIIRLLLDRGADVNAHTTHHDMTQGTALQAAVEAGNSEIVNLLLEHHANPNLGGGELNCPIIAATSKGEEEMLDALLAAKADVDVFGGPKKSTPLINAATYLPQSAIVSLLNAGANIDLADSDGDTALIMAAYVDDSDSVQTLLDYGADVLVKNNRGNNALQEALKEESHNCVEILIGHVSLIMEALRVSIASGNASVAAVVRSVQARKQGLDYDEPSGPPHSEEQAHNTRPSSQPSRPETVDEKMLVEMHSPQELSSVKPSAEFHETSSSSIDRASSSNQSEDLEMSIRRIMHVPTWDSDTSTYDSHYSDTTDQSYPTVPKIPEQETPKLSGPSTPSPAPEVSMYQGGEYRSSTPVSGAIKRKPAPVPPQGYTSSGSSNSMLAELPDQTMGQYPSHMPPPLQPQLQQRPSMPYIPSMPSSQDINAYGTVQTQRSDGQLRYTEPASSQSRQYQAYQPSSQTPPPQQQYHQQQNQQLYNQQQQQQQQQHQQPPPLQQQRVVPVRDGTYQQHAYRQSNPPASHHVPYSQPLVDSQRRSSNPNQPPGHRPPAHPQQLNPNSFSGTPPNGSKYGYDTNSRPVNEGQRPSSFLGFKAPWSGDQRY